jgi:hypothetical protein
MFKFLITAAAIIWSVVTASPAPYFAAVQAIQHYTSLTETVELISALSATTAATVTATGTETVPVPVPVPVPVTMPAPVQAAVPVAVPETVPVPVPVAVPDMPRPVKYKTIRGPKGMCDQGAYDSERMILSGETKLETARSSVCCPHCSHWTWVSQDGPVRKVTCWKGHDSYIYPVKYSCPKCAYSWTTTRKEKLFTVYDCQDCNALN